MFKSLTEIEIMPAYFSESEVLYKSQESPNTCIESFASAYVFIKL
jgi:hypothetical protein